MMRARCIAVALALASATSGCSLVMVRDAPAEPEPRTWPSCTEHRIWPIADAAVALMGVAGAIYFLQSDDDFAAVGVIFEGALAAGFGYAAYNGWSETSRCRDAREAYEKAAVQGR